MVLGSFFVCFLFAKKTKVNTEKKAETGASQGGNRN